MLDLGEVMYGGCQDCVIEAAVSGHPLMQSLVLAADSLGHDIPSQGSVRKVEVSTLLVGRHYDNIFTGTA